MTWLAVAIGVAGLVVLRVARHEIQLKRAIDAERARYYAQVDEWADIPTVGDVLRGRVGR